MVKAFLLFGLFSASLISCACKSSSAAADNAEIEKKQIVADDRVANFANKSTAPKIEKPNAKLQAVNFKGVSFTYNPQVFGKVKSEEVAEYVLQNATDKPDYIAPRHRLFSFDLSTDYNEMSVAVYPIDGFPQMYAADESSVEAQIELIRDFKKALKDKNFRAANQIPFIPFRDASQAFQARVKHFPFQNGKGILFLTHWDTQIELPSNRQLRYVYEGLTDDEKYYVVMEMPVAVKFLPNDATDKFEGKAIETKRFDEVKEKIARRLENLPPNEFKPNLKHLEEIASSLKILK